MKTQLTSPHLVLMGVSGSGKTTIGQLVAERLNCSYAEADEFHPPANIAKMTSGTPLTDEDRAPWLAALRDHLTATAAEGRCAVVTCSALKRAYRDLLRGADGEVVFVHLDGSPELIATRMSGRSGHFMPPGLLPSQFATLEPLEEDEAGLVIDVTASPEDIATAIITTLGLTPDA